MITLSETAAKKVMDDGRRLRDQEPEREVFLRVREIPSVLTAAVRT
jgi:hypothetical protein